jgi:hypothetical protein
MLAAVRYHAAEAFAQLACALPYAERDGLYRQVRYYLTLPGVAEDALSKLTGPDGMISFASIERSLYPDGAANGLRADGSVRFILESSWTNVKKDLQLGKYGENWMSLPGIRPAVPKADFFSYNSLSQIVTQASAAEQKLRELEGWIAPAAVAATQGDRVAEQTAMRRFLDAVTEGATAIPQSICALSAQILTSMGLAMYPY